MSYKYTGSLTGEPFLFKEIRITAALLAGGLDKKRTAEKIKRENLYQLSSEKNSSKPINACLKRIEALDSDELLNILANAPYSYAVQINVYAIMRANRLFREFMTDVIGEKYKRAELNFGKRDVNKFFAELEERDEKVASWKDSTVAKLKQVLVKMLEAAGYLDSVKSTSLNEIQIVPELEKNIRERGDFGALAAFNCFA